MTIEQYAQGPDVYIPVLLSSFLLTVAAYCIFPLVYAWKREKTISTKTYSLTCFCVNFGILIFFTFMGGGTTAAYFLWTYVFAEVGKKILKHRYVLEGHHSVYPELNKCSETLSESTVSHIAENDHVSAEMIKNNKQRFCKLCGGAIDIETKKCTGCGKQYFRNPLKAIPRSTQVVIVIAAVGFILTYLYANSRISYLSNALQEMDKQHQEEMQELQSYADEQYFEGYQQGHIEGYNSAYDKGLKEGWDEGYDTGYMTATGTTKLSSRAIEQKLRKKYGLD